VSCVFVQSPYSQKVCVTNQLVALDIAPTAIDHARTRNGKQDHAYPLDLSKELRLIDETLKMAGDASKPLDPLS